MFAGIVFPGYTVIFNLCSESLPLFGACLFVSVSLWCEMPNKEY